MRKSTPCPMAAFIPSYCACPPSARLSVYAFSLWHAVAVGAFRADACAPPPSGVPGRPPSPPPPCAHVIGLRGRRRGAPSLTAARGFARRCQRICVAGQDSPPEYNCSTVRYLRIANGRRGACCRFELLWLDLRCPVPPRLTSRGLIAILPWRCGPMHNPVHHLRPCCCQLVRAGLNSQARVHPRVHARALRPMDAYVTRVSSSRAAEPEPAAAPEGCSSRAAEPAVAPTAAPAAAPARAAPVAAAAGAAVVPAAAPAAAPAAPTVVHAAAAEVPQPAGASKKWVEFAKNYAESRENDRDCPRDEGGAASFPTSLSRSSAPESTGPVIAA